VNFKRLEIRGTDSCRIPLRSPKSKPKKLREFLSPIGASRPLHVDGVVTTKAGEIVFTIYRWAERPTLRMSAMAKTIPVKPVDRSAVTGRFVTERYAQTHPRTTERERVPISNPKKK